ncbi:hypothetical protein PIB30_031790 [Stylosanthes scabra]|uniref:Bet v I/Major latex protein domain-containing protein n=1 Tax=Stylosanthes scabra TaxID=79078 RepID=A0ABU6Z8T9_9FABA|nr:hypothetical protein [Stylosanthes scabra]
MGVHSFEEEAASPVPPAKLFKATVHDSDEITPKVIPVIQSIEIVEGNGGPGTVKKITAVEDGKSSYVLNKVKINVTFHTKGDDPLTEQIQQDVKQKSVGIFKSIEGYILANA